MNIPGPSKCQMDAKGCPIQYMSGLLEHLMEGVGILQEISNGRTHVSRTPKEPEYQKTLDRTLLLTGSVGIRSHSFFDGYTVYDMTLRIQTPPDGVELIVKESHPQVKGLDRGNPGFLGHIWILRVIRFLYPQLRNMPFIQVVEHLRFV